MTSTTFIGAGNIAQALMGGYLASDPAAKIIASDPFPAQLEKLTESKLLCTAHFSSNNSVYFP